MFFNFSVINTERYYPKVCGCFIGWKIFISAFCKDTWKRKKQSKIPLIVPLIFKVLSNLPKTNGC